MKKLIAISSAAILALAIAAPVAADKGGVANDNACLGQLVKNATPGQLAKNFPGTYENGGAAVDFAKGLCEV